MDTKPLPTSRKQAITEGSFRYRPLKPCLRGHTGLRETLSGICIECKDGWNKAHAAETRAKAKAKLYAAREARQAELTQDGKATEGSKE